MKLISNVELRKLKSRAQRLDPILKVGKNGLSDGFLQSVVSALQAHKLIKIRFDEFKEKKKELTVQLTEQTGSQLVMMVGHVIVLYLAPANPAPRGVPLNPGPTGFDAAVCP